MVAVICGFENFTSVQIRSSVNYSCHIVAMYRPIYVSYGVLSRRRHGSPSLLHLIMHFVLF